MSMGVLSGLRYCLNYLTTVPGIFGRPENWLAISSLLFGKRAVISLKNGCRFRVRSLMDVWTIKETCLDRQYELNGAPIEDGWTVVDIGAGLGDFAILIARENPRSRVYAYEPFPESYSLFQENIALNSVHNVYAFQMAIGARRGKLKLLTKGHPIQYTTTKGRCSEATEGLLLEVEGITLDDVFETNGIARCDFLKMDCEGCEFEALLEASDATLERIARICLEYHNGLTHYTHNDLINHLQRKGFRTKVTPNPVYSRMGFLYAHRI
jgi:FkbM family methyltransferase